VTTFRLEFSASFFYHVPKVMPSLPFPSTRPRPSLPAVLAFPFQWRHSICAIATRHIFISVPRKSRKTTCMGWLLRWRPSCSTITRWSVTDRAVAPLAGAGMLNFLNIYVQQTTVNAPSYSVSNSGYGAENALQDGDQVSTCRHVCRWCPFFRLRPFLIKHPQCNIIPPTCSCYPPTCS